MEAAQPILTVENLSFTYPDGTEGLSEVDLTVSAGEIVTLLGANGCGKTTLLLCLVGLLTGKGHLTVDGDEVLKSNLRRIRRKVGVLFQDPDDQLFMPTVFEDVVFGPLNQGLSEEEAAARAEQALTTVNALHLRDRPPYKLSGGETQRVALARALAVTQLSVST